MSKQNNERFLIYCDSSESYIQQVGQLLTNIEPILCKMELNKSEFQVFLFHDRRKLPTYRNQICLNSDQFQDLLNRIDRSIEKNGCAQFYFETLIGLQECSHDPVDEGTILEEIAHLKLAMEKHPSHTTSPDLYEAEDVFTRQSVSAIGHYFAFQLICDCGGREFLKKREFHSNLIEELPQTQSLEVLKSPEIYSKMWLIPICEVLGIVGENWRAELNPEIRGFFTALKDLFAWIGKIRLTYKNYDDFTGLVAMIFQSSHQKFLNGLPFPDDLNNLIENLGEILSELEESYYELLFLKRKEEITL
ncbi:MAG: hypothetical protein ACTSRC_19900 [Candidatus Helarchaeota archaeon]